MGDRAARPSRRERLVLAAAVAAGLALRLAFLREPFRDDEIYAFINYVRLPAAVIVRLYDTPNNHILFSLIAHALCRLFGLSEIVLRAPAFLCGVLAIPLAWRFARAAGGARAAAACALACAFSRALVSYSVYARGYAVQGALALALAVLADAGGLDRPSAGTAARLAGLSFLILYCVPSGIVFVVPFHLYLFLRQATEGRGPGWGWLVAGAALGAAAAAAAFLPLSADFGALARTVRDPTPSPRFYWEVLRSAASGLVPTPLFAAACAAGLWAAARRRGAGLLLPAAAAYAPLAAAVQAAGPPARFLVRSYTPLFPFLYLAAALGALAAWDRLRELLPAGRRPAAAALAALALAVEPAASTAALLLDPSELPHPARDADAADRDLLRALAPALEPGQTVCGADGRSDALAAMYTIAGRGYGFYGLGPAWTRRPPRRVYVLAPDAAAARRFRDASGLARAGYGPARLAAARGGEALFALDRSVRGR